MTTAALQLILERAARAVAAVRAGASLDDALDRTEASLRPGTQALAFHALRWMGSADVVLRRLAPRAPPPAVASLLTVSIALLWPATGQPMPYPAHLLVDQAVEAARRRAPRSAAFVNAVLRRFLREQDAHVTAALATPLGRWNHPVWWLDRLRTDWPDRWQAIADADNTRAPMTLRVNARRTTAGRYVERLAAAGLAAGSGSDEASAAATVWLDRPVPVAALPGFADGDVSVQDASAQLAAPLLAAGLRPGARVLDACAAPGGKTAHLLELADLDVTALDHDPVRLQRVDETLARLGLSARTIAGDALEPASWWDGTPFDAILLDAPCTASGIVRRHPDVRWLRRPGDVDALAATQSRLLEALWPLLVPGGRLLYATCSVFRDEGQGRADAFLQRHPEAVVVAEPRSPGHLLPLPDNRTARPAAASLPSSAAGDGFFLALLAKGA